MTPIAMSGTPSRFPGSSKKPFHTPGQQQIEHRQLLATLFLRLNEVDQRKDHNPDDIDEVPVEAD